MLSTRSKKGDAKTNCGKQYASEYMDITRCIEQEACIENPRIKCIDKYDLLTALLKTMCNKIGRVCIEQNAHNNMLEQEAYRIYIESI